MGSTTKSLKMGHCRMARR